MQILKKLLAVLLFTAVSLSTVVANGNDEAVKDDGPVTVSVWTVWPDGVDDSNSLAFRKALETAKTDLPGIVIEHDGTAADPYKTKIKTAMAADDTPDVFFSWGAGFVKPFVDAGKLVPLDQYLTDGTSDRIKGGVNSNFTFDGQLYGLTFSQWVGSLYCNKALFDKYGVKIPETYKELLTAVEVFVANGVIPITVGEKDKWPGMFWQNAFAIRTAGAEASNAALAGDASFDTPEFEKSAQLLSDLVAAGGFVEGALGLDYNEGGALYLEGQAAMFFMGNWYAGDIAAHESDILENTVAARFPTVEGGKGDDTQFLGGSIDGFCVSEQAENKEAAATVAKYLMEQVSRNLAADGSGIPTWKTDDVETGDLNPILAQVMANITDSTGYVLAWDTFLEGADADDHKNYVAELFGQTMTASDFASKMQAMNK